MSEQIVHREEDTQLGTAILNNPDDAAALALLAAAPDDQLQRLLERMQAVSNRIFLESGQQIARKLMEGLTAGTTPAADCYAVQKSESQMRADRVVGLLKYEKERRASAAKATKTADNRSFVISPNNQSPDN